MHRKFLIAAASIILIIVSCDQHSPLSYSDPAPEIVSQPQSEESDTSPPSYGQQNTSFSAGQHIYDNAEFTKDTFSGFNPKNGYTSDPDSTGFSIEP
ncbi:MAG: hypothetical protein ACE5D7_06825 [Fidelibacterota bacterium]